MQKIEHLWEKTRRVYRYRLSCTGTGMQWVTCIGTGQRCTGTGCFSSLVLTCFRTVKSRIRIPMSRDPKKRIMGIKIRIGLSGKRTVPRR